MALTSCRECGRQVSDQAKICPHCGVDSPVDLVSPQKNKIQNGTLLALILLALLIVGIGVHASGQDASWAGGIALVVIGIALYFLPSLVASDRGHSNQTSIFIINLFFGWTLIGWVVCLAWAYSGNKS